MRFPLLVTFLMLALGVLGNLTSYASDLSTCGLQCVLQSIAQSRCQLENATCICTDPQLALATTLCLTQNCTIVEALQVANISDLSCGRPIPSRQAHVMSTAGLGGLALVSVIVRLYSRYTMERSLKVDDWIMFFVFLCVIVFFSLGIELVLKGFGKNIWNIQTVDSIEAIKLLFIAAPIYLVINALSRVSILVFYLRIFPSHNFRRICYTIMGWVLLTMIAVVLASFLQCIPIQYNWVGWMGEENSGHCANLNLLVYASSALNIAQDFAVLLLPLPWLFRLNTGWKRKLNVLLMFSVGIFICITSIIRLTKIVEFRATTNPTWDWVDTTYWTAIEAYVSVIVTSLPAIRFLLSKFSPKFFGTDSPGSQQRQNTYTKSQVASSISNKHAKGKASSSRVDPDEDLESAYFSNDNLKLGDKVKGDVYTSVTGGRSGRTDSEVELVDMEVGKGIVIRTQTTVAGPLPSSHSWLEEGSATAGIITPHRDAM